MKFRNTQWLSVTHLLLELLAESLFLLSLSNTSSEVAAGFHELRR